jgi:hypothetical protein
LEGTNTETYWSSQSLRGVDNQLPNRISEILTVLESKRTFVGEFIDSGGEAEIYVSWFATERSGGVTFDPELLKRVGSLGLTLSLDVYSLPNRDRHGSL